MKNIKALPTPDLSARLDQKLLGAAVRARRTQSQLKLDETAGLCGVSKQTLSNIENGIDTTQINTILKVCANLGIELYIKPWQPETEDDWIRT